MINKHIELLKSSGHPSLYLMVSMLAEDNKDKLIQHAVNDVTGKETVVVDGMIGPHTVSAILSLNTEEFAKAVIALHTSTVLSKPNIHTHNIISDHTAKERIMKYLAESESTLIHWNRGEANMTSPYGVYRKVFPNAAIFKYIDELCMKYLGYVIRKRDLRALARVNSRLTREERMRIRDLAWEFYKKNFMDRRVLDRLDTQPKAALTFFSNSVNGGKARGVKSLQYALRMKLTGIVNNPLLKKLDQAIHKNVDLNKGMIFYMKNYYIHLAQKPKYRRFLKGWMNRLKRLA